MLNHKVGALKECQKSLELHGDNPRLQIFVDSLVAKLSGKKRIYFQYASREGKVEAQMPTPPDQDPDRKPDLFIKDLVVPMPTPDPVIQAAGGKKSHDNGEPIKEVKSPGLSLGLSAIVPGLGQYYNGTIPEIIKGSIQIVGFVTGIIIYAKNLDDMNAGRYNIGQGGVSGPAIGGFSLFLSCYLWSAFDAKITSDDINREAAQRRAASDFNIHLTLLNDSTFHVVPAADISLRF